MSPAFRVAVPQEVIEKILKHVDGETLLTCTEVSSEFSAAVNYLGTGPFNAWKKHCRSVRVTHDLISKLYPHENSFNHAVCWEMVYNHWSRLKNLKKVNESFVFQKKLSKPYREVNGILTHGDLILVLMKYNKNCVYYQRILTLDKNGSQIHKTVPIFSEKLFVAPLEQYTRDNVITLDCVSCNLFAIPVNFDDQFGFPKFLTDDEEKLNFKIKFDSGKELRFHRPPPLFDRTNALGSRSSPLRQVKMRLNKCYTEMEVFFKGNYQTLKTYCSLNAKVTCFKIYSYLIFLGTDTGRVYAYDIRAFELFELENYSWYCNVGESALLAIDIIEGKGALRVVCSCRNQIYFFDVTAVPRHCQ